ncbi:hypothetical protein OROMI_012914 [Orobanche minor]
MQRDSICRYLVNVLSFSPRNVKPIDSIDTYRRAFENGDIKLAMKEESKAVGVFAEKVCFICDFTNWVYDCDESGKKTRKSGFYVFVEDLSKLEEGCMEDLKPKVTIDFDDAMSICAIDSTLYFANVIFNYCPTFSPTIYSRDIQTLAPDQVVGADDFCTLPCMLGMKCWPRLASIPDV